MVSFFDFVDIFDKTFEPNREIPYFPPFIFHQYTDIYSRLINPADYVTNQPTNQLTSRPSNQATNLPTYQPISQPTDQPIN